MSDLAHVLRHLPAQTDPNLLIGDSLADDAAVYRIDDNLALVQTLDFFTPIVDDPYDFGRIAAANALSDVYAMGGEPMTALNIVGFPIKDLPADVLTEILRGGAAMAAEAGVTIVGGHTVDDAEPKYGLAVTGKVHPTRFVTARGARDGDLLVLTKPVGSGTVATALKAGASTDGDVKQAVRWMTTLNREASKAMLAAGASGATDVTGYGLLGHLVEMCAASGVSARLDASAVPLLPGALQYAREGFNPGGTSSNQDSVRQWVTSRNGIDGAMRSLLHDPQTSGGLLISLSPDRLPRFVEASGPDMLTAVVGSVHSGPPGAVTVA